MMLEVTAGRSSPQGAAVVDGGVNFRLFPLGDRDQATPVRSPKPLHAEWAVPAGSEQDSRVNHFEQAFANCSKLMSTTDAA